MNALIQMATADLAAFLSGQLPELGTDWWEKHVLERLSFQQQRAARERGLKTLRQLDFAALLRVLDQNWYELGERCRLPREARSWLKELQTVRNKWAHLPAESMASSELYRGADTLGRLLVALGAPASSLEAVEATKARAVAAMAGHGGRDDSDTVQAAAVKRQAASGGGETPPAGAATMFRVGELVALRSDPKTVFPVMEIIPGGAECRYRVFQNNAVVTYYESQLQAVSQPKAERQVLAARDLHAHLTALKILAPSTASLFSLRAGRIRFVPYQYRPVLRLIRADRPRLLIADEVGVGKTIEAGLILRELRARMDIESVLVICPKPLVVEKKWFDEMKRFDEVFTHLDGKMLRHCLHETYLEGEWPEQYARAILPSSLFDADLLFGRGPGAKGKNAGLLAMESPPKFDLVIVDEAHHIRNPETMLHQGVRYFCDHAQAVLLLTATPVQLGSMDLFTLLNVLRPDLVIDQASFALMAEPNAHINLAVHHCRAARPGWQLEARAQLDEVSRTLWGRRFIRESPAFQQVYDRLGQDGLGDNDRVGLIREIEEMYTFGGMLNRTRRRDIGEFTTRKPETVSVDFTPGQRRLHDGLLLVVAKVLARCHGIQSVKFMMTTIRRQAASCIYGLAPLLSDILGGKLDGLELMEASDSEGEADTGFIDQIRADIESLLEQARNLDPEDPKVAAFVRVLLDKGKRPNNKAMVFSTFRHTLAYLEKHVRRAGLRVGLIHGDVPDDERTKLKKRFRQPKEGTDSIDVLLSSEVGCEGLDFEFCDMLVNYDLPWNPMRVEQRIGRIDRYGQKSETVAIVNLVTPGTVDAEIYERCLLRIGVFERTVGGSEEILGEITRELHEIAESFSLSEEERARRLQQLADNGIRQVREEQELETRQAELFGLDVPSQSWRDEIRAAESFWLSPAAIEGAVGVYLRGRLGGDADHVLGEKQVRTLRLNQAARGLLLEDYRKLPRASGPAAREWEKWLKGTQPTLSMTFDQEAAVEDSKIVHMSVLHPLVRQAARFLEIAEPKYFTMEAKSADLPAGRHDFALYRWSKQGVKADESLVAVVEDPAVEAALFALLEAAMDGAGGEAPDVEACDALDARHHQKWSEARASHIAENRQLVEHRIQSLTASHQARCKALEDQLARATNERIRLMKQGELGRANADFERRLADLQRLAEGGDIRATPVVFGTITIRAGGQG